MAGSSVDSDTTLDYLAEALHEAAQERDAMAALAAEAKLTADDLAHEKRLMAERNNAIFTQLEDAVSVSLEPLDGIFAAAGLSSDSILSQIRRGYSGQGGPLTPLSFSTKGEEPGEDERRANSILQNLDRMNLYRIALQKTPFAMPVKSSFRFTSGFGPRWGRMHNGTDFAAAHGTPIYSTADGVVTHAGWSSGYGRLIKIQHEFGIETRYAHLSKIRVNVGQRVSRGERIGDMGNTGRSTGTHLHYEVRVGGKPVNPMTYIKAARDVF
jgi:murein DD-endopeptidase MepM/ murein hydrolase activator NlpD